MALNYTYLILGTIVLCCGMVLTEEVIVLCAFIAFVGFIYNYSNSYVTTAIETETKKIGQEFDVFFEIQKKVIKNLITYHVLQVLVVTQIRNLLEFSKNEISSLIKSKQKGLNAILVNQLEQKLSYLASRETNLASQVQENASKHIVEGIQNLFTGDNKKKKKIKDKFFEENLAKLERI